MTDMSHMQLLTELNIDFMGKRRIAAIGRNGAAVPGLERIDRVARCLAHESDGERRKLLQALLEIGPTG